MNIKNLIQEVNQTQRAFPKDKTVHQLFEEQVAKTPDNIAVVFEGKQLTYKELNQRSNQLARYITAKYKSITNKDLQPDTLIALYLDKSLEMIISILAVLKAGAAYVPISPEFPTDRTKYILDDTNASILLSQAHLTDKLNQVTQNIEIIATDDSQEFQNYDKHNLSNNVKPNNLAYVIYTSGTTGKPKGVMIEHHSFVSFIKLFNEKIKTNNGLNLLSLTNIVFDIFGLEYALPLLNGYKLILTSADKITDEQIIQSDVIQQTPKVISNLCQIHKGKFHQKTLLFGGEKATSNEVKVFLAEFKYIYNVYGPAETTIWSSIKEVDSSTKPSVIGTPLFNEKLYILNNNLQPSPIGVPGELYIGGVGLARGYLNLPELTKERFINNPFASQDDIDKDYTRLYKTGDICKWLANGEIEYIGRNDFQVKLRGFRIELGEIENVLSAIDNITQSCVLVNNETLVAYYVADTEIAESVIKNHLAKKLPEYMIPSFYMRLESFPLTINGKLDRKALPKIEIIKKQYIAPATPSQKIIVKTWQDELQLDLIGIDDNFFQLGGNSITSIKISFLLSKHFKKNIHFKEIFQYPTIKQLDNRIRKINDNNIIIPKASGNSFDLSFAQQRLLFIELFEGKTNAYHIPLLLKLSSQVDILALDLAIKAIIQRHTILRTAYKQKDDGILQQFIVDQGPQITYRNCSTNSELQKSLDEDVNTPFDLMKDIPVRIIFYTHKDEYLLLLNIHHIAVDAWSLDIISNDLLEYYEHYANNKKLSLEPIDIEYKDFSIWKNKYLSRDILDKQLVYWQNKLSGLESFELPLDKERPQKLDYKGDDVYFTLDKELSSSLKQLSKQTNNTLYNILLAGFFIFLNKYTQKNDLTIGTPNASRDFPQLQNIVGFFINNIIFRQNLEINKTAAHLVNDIRNNFIEMQYYQDTPFDEIVSHLNIEKDTSRHPIFQVMFSVQNFKVKNLGDMQKYFQFENISDIYKAAKFDLTCLIDDSGDEIIGVMNYATSLFERNTIHSFINHYKNILKQVVSCYDSKNISQYELLDESEYNQIIYKWNQTQRAFPKDKTVHQLFEEQVAKTPDNIAVVFEGKQLTYKELNQRSNQLARYITAKYKSITNKDLQPDTLIALYLDKSLEMIISILAVLKAGAAYVPISPEFPTDRTKYILDDTNASILLSQAHLTDKLNQVTQNIEIIATDDSQEFQNYDKHNLSNNVKPNNLAYVIYTSGTTGKPKGVMIEHHSFVSFIKLFNEKIKTNNGLNLLSLTNIVFDIFGLEYALPLLNGYKLILTSADKITDEQIIQSDVIQQTPKVISNLCQIHKGKFHQKTLLFGGEKATSNEVKVFLAEFKYIYNVYGPAETTIWSSIKEVDSSTKPSVIGTPLFNEKLYILNNNLQPSPIGVPGELYIGGVGLARGYLNLPELTKERFINNPFASQDDIDKDYTRLYKTGDICKWLANGEIEYIGRNDFQVKLRGFRIELGEIENVLSAIDNITQSCVLVNNETLVAYYVADTEIAESVIKNHLAKKLPEYMIPSFYMRLESFPLTINGKLDRKALPDCDISNIKEEYIAPTTELQQKMCQIWQEVLKIDKVGITDNFFNIGGNSILSIQAAYKMTKIFDTEISIADIFRYKTVANILENVTDEFQLISYFNQKDDNKEDLLFIHPAFAGCEVYYDLIEKLSPYYNCIGIENYNLYAKNKISSLSCLAKFYLEKLDLNDKNKQIILSGWSLGGLIAFEMAYWLERKGFNNIQLILLDPHIPKGKVEKYHAHFNPDKGGRNVEEYIHEFTSKLDKNYVQRVLDTKDIDIILGKTRPTGKLKNTKTTLFKATNQPGYFIKKNNLNFYTNDFNILYFKVDHLSLISNIVENWAEYNYSFISKRFDLLEMQQDKLIFRIFKFKKLLLLHKKTTSTIIAGFSIIGLWLTDIVDLTIIGGSILI
ncbi:non-ribosomal peptide synthetase [Francisella sp. TX07-6608]|uniref:non-ribosomal peptide synthetase n=1 Tax=Francisella sp. TX07-6608 TaxID=573568 RepID=UPI0008F9D2D8|nr:non-ribosomal peptide synthetase [Francisella sp. TX07-6608]OIN83718.1 amino acid adenylation domain protein [Francisella sp. TX07-6608]